MDASTISASMRRFARFTLFLIAMFSVFCTVARAEVPSSPCMALGEGQRAVEAVTGTKFSAGIPCVVQKQSEIADYVREVLREDLPAGRLTQEEAIYRALQFIPKDFDYEQGMLKLYQEQLGGYYDPKRKRFVMASWLPVDQQRGIVEHELTHALQDQNFNLRAFVDEFTLTSDEVLARMALVEGHAIAVSLDAERNRKNLNPLLAVKNLKELGPWISPRAGAFGTAYPLALQHFVTFPYSAGIAYVHSLLLRGGYSEIDAKFRKPPRTTHEVLHPLAARRASGVARKKSTDADYQDTFGEFGVYVWLVVHKVNDERARKLSEYWSGDLVSMHQCDGSTTVEWRIAVESSEARSELENLFQTALGTECRVALLTDEVIVRCEDRQESPQKASSDHC